jgi:O-acetyl-ADP-ribose deacetylase (regulator of RNase III)
MTRFKWTNASVLAFAGDCDPIRAMEQRARELALKAMDDGWTGPPFDPLALAEWRKIPLAARDDIADARTVPSQDGKLILEFNPLRPRGRLRFSIAHEIAHSLFDDCGEEVRYRGAHESAVSDSWQLEVLCNIGAAELLMPLGSFSELAGQTLSIKSVLELRKRFDVSVESCLLRVVKLARQPAAAFCASLHEDGSYHVDYVISASGWECPIRIGQMVPHGSVVHEANAIGFTAVGEETWVSNHPARIECVGLAPYPGSVVPRVVGLLLKSGEATYHAPSIVEVDGDALKPRGAGRRLLVHVIPDLSTAWGGNGFAAQVRRRFPEVWRKFRLEAESYGRASRLGQVFIGSLGGGVEIAHMVAQRGIGPSNHGPRLSYAALARCLTAVCDRALSGGASVHMPRIGTGHGGANWELIRELIGQELVDKGVPTTVYTLPSK